MQDNLRFVDSTHGGKNKRQKYKLYIIKLNGDRNIVFHWPLGAPSLIILCLTVVLFPKQRFSLTSSLIIPLLDKDIYQSLTW